MYYLLRLSPSQENSLILHGVPETMKSLSLDFSVAKPRLNTVPEIDFKIEKDADGNISDNFLAYGVRAPFLNEKGLSCLSNVKDEDVTYFDTNITDIRNNITYTTYKIVNINKAISCVDFRQSELELDEDGDIEFIDKLVLNEEKLTEYEVSICRISEFLPLIVVHDDIRSKMLNLGVTGVNFMRPEELKL